MSPRYDLFLRIESWKPISSANNVNQALYISFYFKIITQTYLIGNNIDQRHSQVHVLRSIQILQCNSGNDINEKITLWFHIQVGKALVDRCRSATNHINNTGNPFENVILQGCQRLQMSTLFRPYLFGRISEKGKTALLGGNDRLRVHGLIKGSLTD